MPRPAKKKEYPGVVAEYKVIIFGEGGVGKSALLERVMYDHFVEQWNVTKDPETHRIIFQTTEGPIRILAVDTVGQERFGARGKLMEGVEGAIVVFDFTARATYMRAKSTLRDIDRLQPKIPAVLVGNKLDVIGPTIEKFREFCRTKSQHEYFEISVKDKTRILDPFLAMIRKLANNDKLAFLGDPVTVEGEVNDPSAGGDGLTD